MIGGAFFHSINDVERRLFHDLEGLICSSSSGAILSLKDIEDDDELELADTFIILEVDISDRHLMGWIETLDEFIVLDEYEMVLFFETLFIILFKLSEDFLYRSLQTLIRVSDNKLIIIFSQRLRI